MSLNRQRMKCANAKYESRHFDVEFRILADDIFVVRKSLRKYGEMKYGKKKLELDKIVKIPRKHSMARQSRATKPL